MLTWSSPAPIRLLCRAHVLDVGPRFLVAYLCDFGIEVRISMVSLPGVVVQCDQAKDAQEVRLLPKDRGALSKREQERLRAIARAASGGSAPAIEAAPEGEEGGEAAAAVGALGLALPAVIRPLDVVPVLLKVRCVPRQSVVPVGACLVVRRVV